MTTATVIDLIRFAVITLLQISAPVLLVSVVVGLAVSILQTTTSIQEQTLTFVPKIVAVLIALVYFGNFIITRLREFAVEVIAMIPV